MFPYVSYAEGKSWGVDKDKKGMKRWGKVVKGPFHTHDRNILDKSIKENRSTRILDLPDVSEVDPSVLAALPKEILAEINTAYKGAFTHQVRMVLIIEAQKPWIVEKSSAFQKCVTKEKLINLISHHSMKHPPLFLAVIESITSVKRWCHVIEKLYHFLCQRLIWLPSMSCQ